MKKVIVYHGLYGCDTGCCGYWVEVDGRSSFEFEHCEEDEELDILYKNIFISIGDSTLPTRPSE